MNYCKQCKTTFKPKGRQLYCSEPCKVVGAKHTIQIEREKEKEKERRKKRREERSKELICLYCKIPLVGMCPTKDRRYCSHNCTERDRILLDKLKKGTLKPDQRDPTKWRLRRIKKGNMDIDTAYRMKDAEELRKKRILELLAQQITPETTDLSMFNLEWSPNK